MYGHVRIRNHEKNYKNVPVEKMTNDEPNKPEPSRYDMTCEK